MGHFLTGSENHSLLSAAAEWDALAVAERRLAKIAERNGDTKSFEVRAQLAERTSEALRIQHATGVPVCTCCHKPLASGRCKNN